MVRLSHDLHAAPGKSHSRADQVSSFPLGQFVELAPKCGQAHGSEAGVGHEIDHQLQALEIDITGTTPWTRQLQAGWQNDNSAIFFGTGLSRRSILRYM